MSQPFQKRKEPSLCVPALPSCLCLGQLLSAHVPCCRRNAKLTCCTLDAFAPFLGALTHTLAPRSPLITQKQQRYLQKKSAKKGKGALGAPSASVGGDPGDCDGAGGAGGGGWNDGGEGVGGGSDNDGDREENEDEDDDAGNESDYV